MVVDTEDTDTAAPRVDGPGIGRGIGTMEEGTVDTILGTGIGIAATAIVATKIASPTIARTEATNLVTVPGLPGGRGVGAGDFRTLRFGIWTSIIRGKNIKTAVVQFYSVSHPGIRWGFLLSGEPRVFNVGSRLSDGSDLPYIDIR